MRFGSLPGLSMAHSAEARLATIAISMAITT